MKKFVSIKLFIFVMFAGMLFVSQGFAQGGNETKASQTTDNKPQRPNLTQILGLSEEQRNQINQINSSVRTERSEANRKLREANRELDKAVYADQTDDADIAAKLKAYQDAQAEVARIRFETELSVRRVLSPEQLLKFREIRQRFNQRHENQPNSRPDDKRHNEQREKH